MEQKRLAAIVEYVEDLVEDVTTPEHRVPGDRLHEAIQLCARMDAAILPAGLIFAAAASMDSPPIRPFLIRFPTILPDRVLEALERVSETLLMITDADLRASGTIAASVFVLRALPDGMVARDRILERLLVMTEEQHKSRAARHSAIFSLLAQAKERISLNALPDLLYQVSDALEDLACDADVFLDNPVELVAKRRAALESCEEDFKDIRVRSGAEIPTLREELEQVELLQKAIGWTRDQTLKFVTELYRAKVMDSRSKIGLSVATLCNILTDLKETLDVEVKDIKVENKHPGYPFSYDWDRCELLLYIGTEGSLTTRIVKEARERVLERLKSEKIDRETDVLDKAIDRYQKARAEIGLDSVAAEEGASEVETLAKCLNLPLDRAYDAVAELYGAEGIKFSQTSTKGISIPYLTELLGSIGEAGTIKAIEVDSEIDGRIPFSVDMERGILTLHAAFAGLSDSTLRRCASERSVEPLPLANTDDDRLADYRDPEKPGSVSDEHNVRAFVAEFGLAEEHAVESFEVLLEGCPGFGDAVSIQALRVIVATLDERLGADSSVDLVTAFSRELPESQKTDYASVAWLASHTEEGETLNMLTFNFEYGEGKRKLPPFSDEMLLEWCRHYRVK